MKRFLSILLTLLMVLSSATLIAFAVDEEQTPAIVERGSCGEKSYYTIDENGRLEISGSGDASEKTFSERQDITSVFVNDGITALADGMFTYDSEIVSARLPEGLTVIPTSIFFNCINLENINIPSSTVEIKNSAFCGTTLNSDIVFPNNIEVIGNWAFAATSAISFYIPESVQSIGLSALAVWGPFLKKIEVASENPCYTYVDGCLYTKDMKSLLVYADEKNEGDWNYSGEKVSFDLPDSVESIDPAAFDASYPVSEINVGVNNSFYCSVDGILYDKDMATLVKYPMAKEGTRFSVPSSVKNLAPSALSGNIDLKYISLPETLMEIGRSQFVGCGVKSLRIPDGVKTIHDASFNYAESLKEIILPAGLKRIDDGAFPMSCSGLESIYYLGSKEQWDSITVINDMDYQVIHSEEEPGEDELAFGNGNAALEKANVYFTYSRADVDFDGHVTSRDARLIKRYVSGSESSLNEVRGDVDSNGFVNLNDSSLALRLAAKKADADELQTAAPLRPYFQYDHTAVQGKATPVYEMNGQEVSFSLNCNDFAGTTDGTLFIKFDPEKLSLKDSTVSLGDGAVFEESYEAGLYILSFFFDNEAGSDEEQIVSLSFDILEDCYSTIEYEFASWNGSAVPAGGIYTFQSFFGAKYKDHYYAFMQNEKNWDDAKAFCESFGGHLVTISSADENKLVNQLSGDISAWIGMKSDADKNEWVTGEEYAFSNWADGEPDHYIDEEKNPGIAQDSVHIFEGGYWDDEFASFEKPFVCEWDNEESFSYFFNTMYKISEVFNEDSGNYWFIADNWPHKLYDLSSDMNPGYIFSHWEIDGVRHNSGEELLFDRDTEIHAVWTEHTDHIWVDNGIEKEATCKTEGIRSIICETCKLTGTETVAKKAHTYKNVIKKATLTADGKITPTCSVCGAKKTATVIPKASGIKLSATSFTYNGKTQKPTLTVKDSAGKAIAAKNYTATWSNANSKAAGTYTVKVTFKGNYSGTKTLKYKIVPRQVTGLKVKTAAKTSIAITWMKLNEAKAYKVQYSSDGKNWKSATVTTNTYTLKNLKAGSKWQFKVTALDSTKKVAGKVSAVLKTGTLCSAPTVTVKSAKSKTATVSWSKVTGAKKYIVKYSQDKKTWNKKSVAGTSLTISKLTGGKTVYVKVFAVNAYGKNSAASAVKSVVVKK